MNLRRATVIGVFALIAIFAISATAEASHVKKIKSHIKITKTQPKFKGKVSATNKACIADRTVKLYAVEPGNQLVGKTKTNSKGHWKIQFQGEGAGVVQYYAKVLKSSQGAAGTIYVCKHDRTPKTTQALPGRLGVAQAAKQTTVFDTDLKLSAKFPAFHGRVKSDSGFCVPGRKVRLYKKKLGHGENNDKKLGVDRSDAEGRWKVRVNDLGSGAFYAKVGKLQSASLGIRCKSAKSNVAVVD